MKTTLTYTEACKALARLRKLPGVTISVDKAVAKAGLTFVTLNWFRPAEVIFGPSSALLFVALRRPSPSSRRYRRSAVVTATVFYGSSRNDRNDARGIEGTFLFGSAVRAALNSHNL